MMTDRSAPPFWLDRPVLLTGASGLLGSWLAKKLIQSRADLVCLLRDWVPQSELVRAGLLEQTRVVRGDVRDVLLLERVLGEYEIDTVFHLAAQTTVQVANRNPLSTFETNIGGTWNVLEACRRSPSVRQIVVASSDKAYGAQDELPYTEESPLLGAHPYDVSKACADLIARAYSQTFGLPVGVTRSGNFYGGGDLNWNRIVPGTIRAVLRGQAPIIRSDGTSLRDYFYVEDAVGANLLLAEALGRDERLHGEAFNFSYERALTVLEVARLILRLMGSELEPVVQNSATGEIPHQHLDASKARRMLEWRPLYTLEEGLERTIAWYRALLAGAV